MKNAYIDFSKMAVSVVAVITEWSATAPVIGYGFNSNGRYAARGLLRDRFIPRLHGGRPARLLDDDGRQSRPAQRSGRR